MAHGVARHKLVDHWRRQGREERSLRALADDEPPPEDPWDAQLDAALARETLERLGLHQALSRPILPVDPDPSFAARLRTRLQSLNLVGGATVPDSTLAREETPNPVVGVVPYLAVADAPRVLA